MSQILNIKTQCRPLFPFFLTIALLCPLDQITAEDMPFALSAGEAHSARSDVDVYAGDIPAPWEGGPAYYSRWSNGLSNSHDFFPIAVWLQSPENRNNANTYKNIGINTFIGLYNGPTDSQLAAVAALSLQTICDQNTVGLQSSRQGVIKAWMHQDEPDNAQGGTQDPVPTTEVIARYQEMINKDASRPVYLNLGQGVACSAWYGRGNRTNHPEDYALYAQGADILSFDTYPMNVFPLPNSAQPWFRAFNNVVAQNIWYVANGVDSLRKWTDYAKPVWVWIECTNINGDSRYALTPALVKSEVWMAIIHGARGIGYFCHQFSPTFIEAGLLANAEMRDAVAAVNNQIESLAPVLNTQSVANGVTATSSNSQVFIDHMIKRYEGHTYLFAVSMRPGTTTATFTLRDFIGASTVEVIGENRTLSAADGGFQDQFTDYQPHIYQIENSGLTTVGENSDSNRQYLGQNYSNPFNHSTTIEYSLPPQKLHDGDVVLKVYDLLGKEVATLIDEPQASGTYKIHFDPDHYGLAGGVFFYSLQTEKTIERRKMIYLR